MQVSATYTLAALSTATPPGWQNRAALSVMKVGKRLAIFHDVELFP
ncbi:MAG: hypothetical protein ABSF95_10355 [Verrucomicrobiota bacterium]